MNAHTRPPAEPQEAALYIRTPVTPEEAFQAIGRLRKEARDEIDRLIRFLDKTDDYVSRELEDSVDDNPQNDEGDAEPSLGWTDLEARRGRHFFWGDVDAELDNADDEPSLGSHVLPSGGVSYVGPGLRGLDCEGDEHDGREPGEDDEPDVDDEDGGDKEPAFGWSDEEAARGRYPSLMGAAIDREA